MTLLESVGDGAPGLRGQADNRPEQGALETNEAFQALIGRLGGEPGPMDGGSPSEREAASEPFHGVKSSEEAEFNAREYAGHAAHNAGMAARDLRYLLSYPGAKGKLDSVGHRLPRLVGDLYYGALPPHLTGHDPEGLKAYRVGRLSDWFLNGYKPWEHPEPTEDRPSRLAQALHVRDPFTKVSWHAHDRMEERTPFHRDHVDLLQRSIDTLQLDPGSYHLPLKNKDGSVAGYAQFKSVPNRKYPVLATVLGPQMNPGGVNLAQMLKVSMEPDMNAEPCQSSLFTTDEHMPTRGPDSSAWRGPHQLVAMQSPLSREIRLGFGLSNRPQGDVVDVNPPSPDDGKP